MKLQLISDVHLDFHDLVLPGGDVLLMAGDIMEARELGKKNYLAEHVLKPGRDPNLRADRYLRFMNEEVTKYNKVFYIAGNHEHYGAQMHKTHVFMRENVPSNTTVLENESFVHDGVLFLGATMWTDFNKGDGMTMMNAEQRMNDYSKITVKHNGIYRKADPRIMLQEHFRSRAYFNTVLTENKQKETPLPVVVMTHHAPTALSIPEWYKGNYLMNGCYCSDLSELILDNPQIKVHVHGHTHEQFDYLVGDTRILCHPRGYYGSETSAYNYTPLEFEI